MVLFSRPSRPAIDAVLVLLLSAFAGWAVLRFTRPIVFSEEDAGEAREIFGDDQYESERHRRENVAAQFVSRPSGD